MYKTLGYYGILTIPTGAGFLPSTVFHDRWILAFFFGDEFKLRRPLEFFAPLEFFGQIVSKIFEVVTSAWALFTPKPTL